LYKTENVEANEKLIFLHFFDGEVTGLLPSMMVSDVFFGFACLNGWKDCAEWGYMSFQELRNFKVRYSLA